MSKQKKKSVIINVSIILILSLFCIFHNFINKQLNKILFNHFSVVSKEDNLLVHFISVGSADAIAINLPDDKIMLIDTGSNYSRKDYINYLNNNVLNLKTNKEIDYLIVTHADIDHSGGTLSVLKNYNVKNLYLPELESTSNYYTELLSYVNDNYSYEYISSEIEISGNDYSIEIFGPLEYLNTNDSCPIIKLTYKNKSFLFTGDISSDVEQDFIKEYGDKLDCDVLKVAHHGSKYSTCDEFLGTITPDYAIISVKEDENHPSDRVLDSLNWVGATTLRTDNDGNIMFVVGEHFDLKYLSGVYSVTGLILDIRFFVLIVDACLIVNIALIIVKKPKNKKKNYDTDA